MVSRKNYYKNSLGYIAHGSSHRNKIFSTQISLELLILSVTPLPEVIPADYENSLRVRLRNNGAGPMIVRTVSVVKDGKSRSSIIAWMPGLPGGRPWNHFSSALTNRSLQPGSEINLLELTEYEKEEGFSVCRDMCREALSKLTVTVSYTDIYGTEFPPYIKSLEWFGRNSPEPKEQLLFLLRHLPDI